MDISIEEINQNESCEIFIENITISINDLSITKNVNDLLINKLQSIAFSILKRYGDLKNDPSQTEKCEKLNNLHDSAIKKILIIYNISSTDDLRYSALKALINLLPYQIVLNKKRDSFPDNNLAEILKAIMLSKSSIDTHLPLIQDILNFPDVSRNIWKALEIACYKEKTKLSPEEIKHFLEVVNCIGKRKADNIVGPDIFFCRTSGGLINEKQIGTCVMKIWDKLAATTLPPIIMQSLLLTLHEKLMPRMKKPIFLTDFFMTVLEFGGSLSILALQGIFTLCKDENMNYPNVYKKLYSMVSPDLFEAQYKARFYYLTDIFLSSSHLPESLVASFVKRFARLSLVAPPPDCLILLAFIQNLILRHRGLKKLINNPSKISYENDPYNAEEEDPAVTGAGDSTLWEVELLEAHALPSVSAATFFIRNPFNMEKDLALLLETTTDEIFSKEHKKKVKYPPVSFEKPTSLFVPNTNIFNLWNLSN